MAGVSIEIDVHGASAIEKALNRLARTGRDLDQPLKDIGEHLLGVHKERWQRQESPEGIPWEPLSEAYARRKRGEKPNAGILVYSGTLRRALTYQIRGNALLFGTKEIGGGEDDDRDYAATHQFGRESGRGAPIPARPFLGLSKAGERDVLDIIREHLRRIMDGV